MIPRIPLLLIKPDIFKVYIFLKNSEMIFYNIETAIFHTYYLVYMSWQESNLPKGQIFSIFGNDNNWSFQYGFFIQQILKNCNFNK